MLIALAAGVLLVSVVGGGHPLDPEGVRPAETPTAQAA